MGKFPVRLKEVVYTLSPFEQDVLPGLWRDYSKTITKKVSQNFAATALFLIPAMGTVWYCGAFKEKEKMEHRY